MQETDGFQVKRPGDVVMQCTILLLLDYKPIQIKLIKRLARLMAVHIKTRSVIISILGQYISLRVPHDKEYFNCSMC